MRGGCWAGHNLTRYNYPKNRPTGHDVKCYKMLEYVFIIINHDPAHAEPNPNQLVWVGNACVCGAP